MEPTYNTHTEISKIARPEEHGNNQIIDAILFSNLINVIIVVLFFVWLFRKFNLLSFLAKKRDGILEAIKSVENERKLRKTQLEQTKVKVKNVNQEVIKLVDEGEQVAENISARIIKDAELEASDMQQKALFALENEKKIASGKIIQDVTNAAFVIAEEHIKEAVDEKLHKKYINEFIDNMDSLKVQ